MIYAADPKLSWVEVIQFCHRSCLMTVQQRLVNDVFEFNIYDWLNRNCTWRLHADIWTTTIPPRSNEGMGKVLSSQEVKCFPLLEGFIPLETLQISTLHILSQGNGTSHLLGRKYLAGFFVRLDVLVATLCKDLDSRHIGFIRLEQL